MIMKYMKKKKKNLMSPLSNLFTLLNGVPPSWIFLNLLFISLGFCPIFPHITTN